MNDQHSDQPTDQQAASDGSRDVLGRARGPVSIVVLVLILLMTFLVAVDGFSRFRLSQARFVVQNLDCLSCHTEVLAQMSLPSQHQPFETKRCTSCHTPHGWYVEAEEETKWVTFTEGVNLWLRWGPFRWLIGPAAETAEVVGGGVSTSTSNSSGALGESELIAPLSTLCWTCHPTVAQELGLEVQHLPFERAQCTSCHNPHASNEEPLLAGPDSVTCGQCHPMRDLDREHLHQPAEDWSCRSCHKPHSSEHDGMLVERQGVLCLTCHPSVAGDFRMRVLHQPFGDSDCTGCHEPHGADAQPLLIAEQPELCYLCHPKIERRFALESHHPLQEGLECGACHRVHSGDYEGLVRVEGNELCYLCHGTVRTSYQVSNHSSLDCARCHNPHGSQYRPMLQKMNPTVCLGCHQNSKEARFQGDNTHPASPKFLDKLAGAPLTCTSTCHNPHGTSHDYMVRNYPWFWDGTCLQCHVDVGVEF